MIDLAFALDGGVLPREHRRALAAAVEQVLPWLAGLSGAAVHPLNVSAGGGPEAMLSGRTRLTLRVPRGRADAAAALVGAELDVGGRSVRVGPMQARELLPHGTLYAHLVVAADDEDEVAFLRTTKAELDTLGVPCRAICGRHQITEGGALQGYSLMLDGLSAAAALRVLEAGLGRHRRLGCGVFVPHRSAAAVGVPP